MRSLWKDKWASVPLSLSSSQKLKHSDIYALCLPTSLRCFPFFFVTAAGLQGACALHTSFHPLGSVFSYLCSASPSWAKFKLMSCLTRKCTERPSSFCESVGQADRDSILRVPSSCSSHYEFLLLRSLKLLRFPTNDNILRFSFA